VTASRTDVILGVLRAEEPVRQLMAHELRGSLVQLLGPSTTNITWQAPPGLLAEAIDKALRKQERERKDTLGGTQPSGTADTARTEILAVLEVAGYNPLAAAGLLARAYREPHDSPPDEESRETLAGGHALIVQYGDCEFIGSCQCGQPIGRTPRTKPIDHLAGLWERHTAPILDGAWSDAVTVLPTTSIGAS